ncbi:MAG: FMN-binding protein [Saezia sp.]
MRKTALFLTVMVFTLLLTTTGCAKEQYFQDGNYTAEFAGFDSRGYKDFLRVTVKDKLVTHIEFDAMNKDENLKSQDTKYEADMKKVQSTYPTKYSADLINQYLDVQYITKVDAIAGATYSSDGFIALFTALEKNMLKGNTEKVVVENVPIK